MAIDQNVTEMIMICLIDGGEYNRLIIYFKTFPHFSLLKL